MQIFIKSYGVFRDALGKDEIILSVAGPIKLKNLIDKLISKNNALKLLLIDLEIESPLSNSLILLNGVEVKNLQGLDTIINEESSIILLPVTHGG
jgi:molybdopterin converting factor small subunit